jgi:hypothetical protein
LEKNLARLVDDVERLRELIARNQAKPGEPIGGGRTKAPGKQGVAAKSAKGHTAKRSRRKGSPNQG